MKEIKFRVWDGRESSRGMHYLDNMMILGQYGDPIALAFHPYDPDDVQFIDDYEAYDPQNTMRVMQFTGLKDEKGKEIYEGDVVDIYFNTGDHAVGQVIWSEFNAAFSIPYGNQGLEHALNGIESSKVIGNTYENTELLK